MEPQAAAEIARRGIQRLAGALENPQEKTSDDLSNLGKRLAAFCALLPSAYHTHLLALSNLLLTPEWQPYDRKLLTAVGAQLRPQDLTEVLKYPFITGERELIVLNAISPNFGGNLWNKPMRLASKISAVPHSGRRCRTRLMN